MEDKDFGKKEEEEEIEEHKQEPSGVSEGKEIALQRETTCLNCGVVFDQEKVFCPQCGLKAGGAEYLPTNTFISPVERAARGVGILPLISLLLGILGPFFLGIGWILAIVLGMMSLSTIKKRGGFPRDRKMAMGGVILGFVWPLIIGSVVLIFFYRSVSQRRISRNEASAISDLKNIALTERFAKSGFFFDRDNDGKSEYVDLASLAKVSFRYFDSRLSSGEKNGYLFRIDRATEESFSAVAIPLTYGITGRRTFFIDQSGILRGGDIRGKGSEEGEQRLSKISPQSVFNEFDNEIAGDLLQKAKQEAKKRNFDRARKILEEIRNNYYLSSASKEVNSVIGDITAYMAGDEAKKRSQKAKMLINEGKYSEALVLLRATEKDYPGTFLMSEIKAEIEKAEKRLAERKEKEAKELFSQGQAFEVEGKYEEALKNYERINQEFKSTSYFKKTIPLLGSVRKKIEERKAEALFAQLNGLKPEKDWAEILRIVSLLKTGYAGTDLVKGRQSILAALQSRSKGQDYKNKGLEELKKQDYQAAQQDLENALRADSSLREELKIPLQVCYLKLGDKYFQEKNYEKAVSDYENYLKLNPAKVALESDKYNEAYYQLGKLAYDKGNLEKAKESLLKARYAFPKRAEIYYLLGSILARQKDYVGALGYLNIALKLERNNQKFLYKRGLVWLAVAEQLEGEVSGLLEKKDKSLKRGRSFVDTVAAMINEAEVKSIQLELQARPRILAGKKELTPQQIKGRLLASSEREKHLAKMRAETAKLESNLRQNESRQVEIIAKLRGAYESMDRGRNDLERSAIQKSGDSDYRELINLLRRKEQLFSQGKNKLELGLNQENKFVEERAFSALQSALRAFKGGKSLSRAAKETRTIYDSLFMSQLESNLREGRELLKKADAIDLRVDKYLTTKAVQ
ncbi:MAG: tetratricopeptide repeat protein [Nitrospirae bacterium]|nr:tetratricopeptide repeat protein [Nitrospirota bacterium]